MTTAPKNEPTLEDVVEKLDHLSTVVDKLSKDVDKLSRDSEKFNDR